MSEYMVLSEHFDNMVSSFGELKNENIPEPVTIFGNWLNKGDACLVHAPAGVGKSWLSMSVACAIAGAREFAGWRCESPHEVFYIDGEMGAHTLREMAKQCSLAVRAESGMVDKNLFLCTDRGTDGETMDLCCPVWQNVIIDRLDGRDAVVILDNVRTLFWLDDENSASSWQVVNDFIKRLRKIATVIIIHHDKKSGGFSGSGAAETIMNTRIALSAVNDDKNLSGCGACFSVSFLKIRAKAGAQHQTRSMGLHKEHGWLVVENGALLFDSATKLAKTGRYQTQKKIAEALDILPQKLNTNLKKYDPDGVVKSMLRKAKHKEDKSIAAMDVFFEKEDF